MNTSVSRFNDHFTCIGPDLASTIQAEPYGLGTKDFPINQLPTEPSEIVKVIRNRRNAAAGHDHVRACVLKRVAEIVTPVLSYLINLSFKYGIFLHTLKTAVMSPIFKANQRITLTITSQCPSFI